MKNKALLLLTAVFILMVTACPTPTDPIEEDDNNNSGGGGTVVDTSDYTSPNIGTLKYVPAGQFQRDATSTNISIITQPYRMSQYEITRQQFFDIMGADPSDATYSSGMSDPVQRVNWYHAIAFCNKLSLEEGLEPVYSVSGITDWAGLAFGSIPTTTSNATWNAATCDWTKNGYRLSTEMEWMWAAMGAEDDYTKAFAGDDGTNSIGDYAVYGYYDNLKNDGQTTTQRSNPVGSKNANELGLYDMSGNVFEWCWDWHGGYPAGEQTDYTGAASGFYRVFRGGSWIDNASFCAVSYRSGNNPYYQNSGSGFRVVRP